MNKLAVSKKRIKKKIITPYVVSRPVDRIS